VTRDSTVKRLSPRSETVRRLFLLSGNQCAFPGCNHPIITKDGHFVGEMCHIRAAETGGERFDSTQNNEDRRDFSNLILMCHDHHVVTNNVADYPVERMCQMKADHESRFESGLSEQILFRSPTQLFHLEVKAEEPLVLAAEVEALSDHSREEEEVVMVVDISI
jgi:hypothetical protein